MKIAWQIAAATFAVLFAAWAQQSWQLSLQDALGPGPGFFPFCLSIAGVVLAAVVIVQSRRGHESVSADGGELIPGGVALMRALKVLAALTVVTALLDVIGYRLAMAAFCVFLLHALGSRNWWVIVVFALVASFGVYGLFSNLLKVPLPLGLAGF